jgi:hypothetical protein
LSESELRREAVKAADSLALHVRKCPDCGTAFCPDGERLNGEYESAWTLVKEMVRSRHGANIGSGVPDASAEQCVRRE